MPWLDPARAQESTEDRELREELRGLLGAPSDMLFPVQPSAEMIALATDLRREAERRKRTARRPSPWTLALAAGLPLAIALGGLSLWGLQQKNRADALAASIRHKELELVRQQEASKQELARERQALQLAMAEGSAKPGRPARLRKDGELVIPAEKPSTPYLPDLQQVKAQGR